MTFQKLKQVMSQPPLMALPNFTIPFILETDACHTGLGTVLMQQSRPLAYFSKCLGPKNAEKSVYEKELRLSWRPSKNGDTIFWATN
jgi:hypothetical protein